MVALRFPFSAGHRQAHDTMPDPGPRRPPASPSTGGLPQAVRLTLVARHPLAPEVVEVRLRPPAGVGLAWHAGQYLDLIPADGRHRSFSIANPPPGVPIAPLVPAAGGPVGADELVLHVRRGTGTSYSRVLAELPVGSVIDAEVARGDFRVAPAGAGRALWLAGGTGLAPLMAMLATVLPSLPDNALQHLFWGVREEADLYAAPSLNAWVRRYPAFAWTPVLSAPPTTWAGAQGLVHEVLLDVHGDLRQQRVYASGPPAMIRAAQELLPAAGLPGDRLLFDRFEPVVARTG